MIEEKSKVYKDYLNYSQLSNLTSFAKSYVNAPNILPDGIFWFRRGNIHKQTEIQTFSKKYIEPLLNERAILIGDTAFLINYPPHDIHIDCPNLFEGIRGYKSVVIPLEIDTDNFPILYTAEQYFYGPTTRFRNGSEILDDNLENQRQRENGVNFCYDYVGDGVKYLSDNNLSQEWYVANIDQPEFVPYSNFAGISIEAEHEWKPGNIIIFDNARIHFAQTIEKVGATYKLGISLNYGIRE